LSALQAALYLGAVVVFYFLHGHLRTEKARLNHRAGEKRLTQLHNTHAKAAAELNREVMTLHANWAANIAKYKNFIYEYLAELPLNGLEAPVNLYLADKHFAAIPDWVWHVADPQPAFIQDFGQVGPLDDSASNAARDQHHAVLLGQVFNAHAAADSAHQDKGENAPSTSPKLTPVSTNASTPPSISETPTKTRLSA
jgi:hypothetical protein